LLNLFFDPEDGSDVSPKTSVDFTGLHGDISKEERTLQNEISV
jgi:hypothetical protein